MDFERYVAERRRALFRFAVVLCGDEVFADDLLAQVLSVAFERWDRIRATEQPHAYVRRMLVNEYLASRKRAARYVPRPDVGNLIDQARQGPDLADTHATHAELVDELTRLPRKQRAAVVLRFYEGLDDDQIAEIMGIRRTAVRSNISRGLARLRITLTVAAADAAPRPAVLRGRR